MAGKLSADTAVLRASGGDLVACADAVLSLKGDGSLAVRRGDYGHAALAGAAAGFAERWVRGLQAAGQDVAVRGHALQAVAQAFEDVDSAAAIAARNLSAAE